MNYVINFVGPQTLLVKCWLSHTQCWDTIPITRTFTLSSCFSGITKKRVNTLNKIKTINCLFWGQQYFLYHAFGGGRHVVRQVTIMKETMAWRIQGQTKLLFSNQLSNSKSEVHRGKNNQTTGFIHTKPHISTEFNILRHTLARTQTNQNLSFEMYYIVYVHSKQMFPSIFCKCIHVQVNLYSTMQHT